MRTTTRAAAAVLTTAVVVAGTATSASAQSTTIKDRATDVVSTSLSLTDDVDLDLDDKGTPLTYAESLASGVDIRSMRVSHGKQTVGLTLRFSNLGRGAQTIVAFRLDGRSQPERVLVSTSSRSARILKDDGKADKDCRVPLTTKTGRNGYIRAVIDRSCLDDTRRIKVSSASVSITMPTEDSLVIVQDVISPKNLRVPSWTKWLRSS